MRHICNSENENKPQQLSVARALHCRVMLFHCVVPRLHSGARKRSHAQSLITAGRLGPNLTGKDRTVASCLDSEIGHASQHQAYRLKWKKHEIKALVAFM